MSSKKKRLSVGSQGERTKEAPKTPTKMEIDTDHAPDTNNNVKTPSKNTPKSKNNGNNKEANNQINKSAEKKQRPNPESLPATPTSGKKNENKKRKREEMENESNNVDESGQKEEAVSDQNGSTAEGKKKRKRPRKNKSKSGVDKSMSEDDQRVESVQIKHTKKMDVEEKNESDSDDAPEEVTFSTGKESALQKKKEEVAAKKRLDEERKAKRRKITQTLQETSKNKKEKEKAKPKPEPEESSEEELLSPEVLKKFAVAETVTKKHKENKHAVARAEKRKRRKLLRKAQLDDEKKQHKAMFKVVALSSFEDRTEVAPKVTTFLQEHFWGLRIARAQPEAETKGPSTESRIGPAKPFLIPARSD